MSNCHPTRLPLTRTGCLVVLWSGCSGLRPRLTSTKLNNAIQLSGRDLCELYAKIPIDMAEYQGKRGGFFRLRQQRQVLNNFQDTEYFSNDHHANQFKKRFPGVWSALGGGVTPANRAAFDGALKMLRDTAPTTFLSLERPTSWCSRRAPAAGSRPYGSIRILCLRRPKRAWVPSETESSLER
jgi:hypothetical protein